MSSWPRSFSSYILLKREASQLAKTFNFQAFLACKKCMIQDDTCLIKCHFTPCKPASAWFTRGIMVESRLKYAVQSQSWVIFFRVFVVLFGLTWHPFWVRRVSSDFPLMRAGQLRVYWVIANFRVERCQFIKVYFKKHYDVQDSLKYGLVSEYILINR